jgi:RIO-like serine/threonine protein kinase
MCQVIEAVPKALGLRARGQDINLRELTKKYGRGIGLNVAAVRAYAAQMLTALYHLRNCGVLHADIKPDNILVRCCCVWLVQPRSA